MHEVRNVIAALLAVMLPTGVPQALAQQEVEIPIDLPIVDLAQMNQGSRTATLTVATSCRFVNGTISAADTFGGEGPLMRLIPGVTVIVDATAAIDAGSAPGDKCTAAVSIAEGATFMEMGDVTAPDKGEGVAIFLEAETATYRHVSGTLRGSLADADGIYGGFQVEQNDLLALRAIHQALGGAAWTSRQWSFDKNGHRREDFPGVTFNDEGRVTAIELPANGLKGMLPTMHEPQLTELLTLDMSRNALTGDLGPFIAPMRKMQKLNMSYNQLTQLSVSLPATCTSANLQYQNRQYGNTDYLTDQFFLIAPPQVTVNTQGNQAVSLPSLFTHYAQMRRGLYGAHGPSAMLGTLNDVANAPGWQRLSWNADIYSCPQDTLLALIQEEGVTRHSALPVVLHYVEGDADMTGQADVLDVQHTLNYILSPATIKHFNLSAANTYNSDNIINVQDIVSTVNIILDASPDRARMERSMDGMAEAETATDGELYVQGDCLMLRSGSAVAAIDIELEGATTDQVGLLLNRSDFQMIGRNTPGGSRYVIFSPTGQSIGNAAATGSPAAGAMPTPLLRLYAPAQPVTALAADRQAQPVALAIGSEATGIEMAGTDIGDSQGCWFDLRGQRVKANAKAKGIYIHNGRKMVR